MSYMSEADGYYPEKSLALERELARAECKIDSLTKRLIDADQDVARLRADLAAASESHQRTNAKLATVEDQLAAERERCAKYNEMAGRDADELAQLRANLADCSTALDLTITERDRYADDAAALAAIVAAFNEWDAAEAVPSAHETGNGATYDERIALCLRAFKAAREATEEGKIDAILASVKAAQRRKGAAWALRDLARILSADRTNPLAIIDGWLQVRAQAIESGEVEVPGE